MRNEGLRLIFPYALWMVLMVVLPSTPICYAVRTFATLAAVIALWRHRLRWPSRVELLWGLAMGVAVCVIWVFPERFELYRRFCIFGEGGVNAIAESSYWLIAIKLFGSAFVISVAEELFFRKWMIGFAGFWWMVALFAIEHDRWLVGAIAGMLYGWLYLRKGLLSAIIAHAVTNFALGLWVIMTDSWNFW